jgi:UDP-N-acetylglucosamine/UDP-N-acetylgalactosamine diphosphorylase
MPKEEKVDRKPAPSQRIEQLIKKGVDIPSPLTVDVGAEVDLGHISADGVKLFPGCRIHGEKTVISAHVQLGQEAPVTLDNCRLGPGVELKGGYFCNSVFLDQASLGLGAHVREACLLEEQANGAHCVGLKHTILFPFVTLGSLINFCDCLMAGGTSRKDHSEVGSSYVHFNFTPDGDKATASLIGDVPRGVMLNRPQIFLGGQGGLVGPVRIGYGTVAAAGSILREDVKAEGQLVVSRSHPGKAVDFIPGAYPHLSRIIENNVIYVANLMALEQWYLHVRRFFFDAQEFGPLIFSAALETLRTAKEERIRRLRDMAAKMPVSLDRKEARPGEAKARREFLEKSEKLGELLKSDLAKTAGERDRDRFLDSFAKHRKENGESYVATVQGLPPSVSRGGTRWLDAVVLRICGQAGKVLPALNLFKPVRRTRDPKERGK